MQHGAGLLKGPCLEGLPHLECVEAVFAEEVELLQASAHQLHGEGPSIDGCVGVQGWDDLHIDVTSHQHLQPWASGTGFVQAVIEKLLLSMTAVLKAV